MNICFYKKKYLNTKGGASVIVVVFLLVLIIISLTALMTAVSNEKLTLKTKKWIDEYNILETKANEKYLEIKKGNIKDNISRREDGKLYIDYKVEDENIKDKWIEVTLIVKGNKVVVEKWIEKQKPFIIEDSTTYFKGEFND